MRIGQNPAKFVNTVEKPANITVVILSYIPYISGFYAQALDVLRVCLNSVFNENKLEFDLMVFDNGSCEEVQDYLLQEQRDGKIQFLTLSEKNLGKGGAWNVILQSAPGEYIAYADSDVNFHQNWLSQSMQIMKTFPRVGMVTARPFFTKREFLTSTFNWAENAPDSKIERGKLIAWDVFSQFNLSLGQEIDAIRAEYEAAEIVQIEHAGVKAIAGASHWQFLTRKDVIAQFLPFDMTRPMGQVRQLDEKMNAAGYLRLMTAEPLADNMSNTLTVNTESQANADSAHSFRKKKSLLEFGPIKKLLLALHHRIFLLYYDKR